MYNITSKGVKKNCLSPLAKFNRMILQNIKIKKQNISGVTDGNKPLNIIYKRIQ